MNFNYINMVALFAASAFSLLFLWITETPPALDAPDIPVRASPPILTGGDTSF